MSAPDLETLKRRIRNLLKLGACKTAPEAASAAAMAQSLMERYKIDRAMVAEESGVAPERPRPVERTVYHYGSRVITQWISTLANTVCNVNGCYSWTGWENLVRVHVAAGQPEDLDAASYLIGYLVREVERLADEGSRRPWPDGPGAEGLRTWGNSFRTGAVHEIHRRLNEAKRAAWERAKNPALAREHAYREALAAGDAEALVALDGAGPVPEASYALARVETALVRQAEDLKALVKAKKKEHGLTSRRGSRARLSGDGYAAGKRAGAKVDLGRNHRQLGGGR